MFGTILYSHIKVCWYDLYLDVWVKFHLDYFITLCMNRVERNQSVGEMTSV